MAIRRYAILLSAKLLKISLTEQLFEAVKENNIMKVRVLLRFKANVDAINEDTETTLLTALVVNKNLCSSYPPDFSERAELTKLDDDYYWRGNSNCLKTMHKQFILKQNIKTPQFGIRIA
ncbi:hypothetical protein N3Z16_04935 [Candidatus Megaera polyxenophila]|uniref:hypothetical protein n=1 Tax=Candidatus Megaera polyxenophila TaxID=988779 RepID=UPI00249E11DE|nr:hypothetical protein N3Z16_04935 [Candidatus Megaera polyxenophila]